MSVALFFINSEVGGAERMSVLISKMLINNGINVVYVVIKNKENAASILDFLPDKQKIIVVKKNNHVTKIIRFYQIIKDIKPNVVFASHYSINNKILLVSPFFKKSRFVIRSDNYFYTFSRMSKLIIRLTYWMADSLIVQTKEMQEEFVSNKIIAKNKVYVLENPVDKEIIDLKLQNVISPFYDDSKKHIVSVGRFAFQKGYDLLVKSFAILLSHRSDCELYIVGANTEKWSAEYEKTKELISKLGVENSVYCVGYQSNPYRYIKFADCFVLSSRWEGLPNVLAEALYLHTPVAAFKCIPIIERMIRDGIDGFLAEKDDIKSLAVAMENALKLGRTCPGYVGASEEDFVNVFK